MLYWRNEDKKIIMVRTTDNLRIIYDKEKGSEDIGYCFGTAMQAVSENWEHGYSHAYVNDFFSKYPLIYGQ